MGNKAYFYLNGIIKHNTFANKSKRGAVGAILAKDHFVLRLPLEMGWVNVRNLLPNQHYENVLTPTELKGLFTKFLKTLTEESAESAGT